MDHTVLPAITQVPASAATDSATEAGGRTPSCAKISSSWL